MHPGDDQRGRIAAAHGIPHLADRLRGETVDDLNADAAKLAALGRLQNGNWLHAAYRDYEASRAGGSNED